MDEKGQQWRRRRKRGREMRSDDGERKKKRV